MNWALLAIAVFVVAVVMCVWTIARDDRMREASVEFAKRWCPGHCAYHGPCPTCLGPNPSAVRELEGADR